MESLTRTAAMAWRILAVLLAVAAVAAAAQASLCSMSEEGLRACRPYISNAAGGKPAVEKPTEACCGPLRQANLTCLCSYKNSDVLPLLGIDPNLAMQLPSKCSITPPDQC